MTHQKLGLGPNIILYFYLWVNQSRGHIQRYGLIFGLEAGLGLHHSLGGRHKVIAGPIGVLILGDKMKTILRNYHSTRSRTDSSCWSDDRSESQCGSGRKMSVRHAFYQCGNAYGYAFWSACWSRSGKKSVWELFGSINFGNII